MAHLKQLKILPPFLSLHSCIRAHTHTHTPGATEIRLAGCQLGIPHGPE